MKVWAQPSLTALSWLAALESLKTSLNKQTGPEGNAKELHEDPGKERHLELWKMSCRMQSLISEEPSAPESTAEEVND